MREEGLSVAEEIEWFVGIDWASQSHQVCLVERFASRQRMRDQFARGRFNSVRQFAGSGLD